MLKVVCTEERATLPRLGTSDSAGVDLFPVEAVTLLSHTRQLVRTGIKVALPEGTYGRIASRSGNSYRFGIEIGAGVIDRDYRGEIGVIVYNHGDMPVTIPNTRAIAQLILERYVQVTEIVQVDELDETTRGHDGFGSTDVH